MPPKRGPFEARLSPQAEADVGDILEWSEEHFGHDALLRYAELMMQALRDIEEDPNRPGVRKREELPASVYIYHLSTSRDRVAGAKVKSPRHFILYRLLTDDELEVLRVLHDSRDPARHLPKV